MTTFGYRIHKMTAQLPAHFILHCAERSHCSVQPTKLVLYHPHAQHNDIQFRQYHATITLGTGNTCSLLSLAMRVRHSEQALFAVLRAGVSWSLFSDLLHCDSARINPQTGHCLFWHPDSLQCLHLRLRCAPQVILPRRDWCYSISQGKLHINSSQG